MGNLSAKSREKAAKLAQLRRFTQMWSPYWHYGIYEPGSLSLQEAQMKTTAKMVRKANLRRMAVELDAPITVLDAGCGIGSSLIDLEKYFKTLEKVKHQPKFIGFDADPVRVEYAHSEVSEILGDDHNVKIVQGFVEKIDLESDSVDAILCSEVLCHVEDKSSALAEFVRVLKPGKRLVLTDLVQKSPSEGYVEGFHKFHDHSQPMVSQEQYVELLRSNGFIVEEHLDFSHHLKRNFLHGILQINIILENRDEFEDISERELLMYLEHYQESCTLEVERALGWSMFTCSKVY